MDTWMTPLHQGEEGELSLSGSRLESYQKLQAVGEKDS